jgi:short-subunit dehydrogenase
MNNNDFMQRYGPTALVTGASSGIGKSFAEALAQLGMNLVLVARRVERLVELASRLRREYRIEVQVCRSDLAQVAAAEQLADTTRSVDIGLVVSNAGFGLKGDHTDNDPQAMVDMLMVNCNTPMLLAHRFIPRLRKRGKGGIIFTSSVEGLIGCPFSTAYSASKAFVNSLGEGLWGELVADGIHVLTICPGATDTEAAALQGIDLATLQNVMSPGDVVRLALENMESGPIFITSEYYKATFDHLLSMPRRDALTAIAKSMKERN